LVDRRTFPGLLQQFRRNRRDGDHFLDRPDHLAAGQRLNLRVDIYRGFRVSLFLLVLQILALKLNREIGQHGGTRKREIVHADLHRQQVVFDA
jgi:hypothetical protein